VLGFWSHTCSRHSPTAVNGRCAALLSLPVSVTFRLTKWSRRRNLSFDIHAGRTAYTRDCAWLSHVFRCIGASKKLVSGEHHYTQHDQDAAAARFQQLTGKISPNVDITGVQVRELGLFDKYGEGSLEGYNSCINVLMLVHYSLTSSRWASRFGSNTRKAGLG
jgi:hypothetical protein